jgi:hypothetical protein
LNGIVKKIFVAAAALLVAALTALPASAQQAGKYFNSLAVGVSAGTDGIGVDLATPIGAHFALRAGLSFVPNFKFNTEFDVSNDYGDDEFDYENDATMDATISMKRISGNVLLNIYPAKSFPLFLCAGAYFGGSELLKIDGHSDDIANFIQGADDYGIVLGDYSIPVDKNGNVSGGIRVKSFRPYVGIGFGRAVPKKRVGFMTEMGVQFHKSPEVYTSQGAIRNIVDDEDDTSFSEILSKITVYPVIKFRLCGRLF